jgi:hypothetical protein
MTALLPGGGGIAVGPGALDGGRDRIVAGRGDDQEYGERRSETPELQIQERSLRLLAGPFEAQDKLKPAATWFARPVQVNRFSLENLKIGVAFAARLG